MTLAEVVISLGLALAVTTTALSLVAPASRASVAQPESMDVEQRARVAAETIARALEDAGVGVFAGPGTGLLTDVPAVLPRRLGAADDAPEVARADAITILAVPSTRSQTTLAAPVSASDLTLAVAGGANCMNAREPTDALCGLSAGADALIADTAGHFDVFRVADTSGATAALDLHGRSLGVTYPAGSLVTEVTSTTYYLDAASHVLRQYDGHASDQPVVDHITALQFDYFVDGAAGLVPVDRARLEDGPWLGAGSSRFDADLLRVRMVRVTAAAEAADATLRATVPAARVQVDVAPRAMGIR